MSLPDERPSCAIVSHSYLEPELSKSLDALAAHVDVRLITPRYSQVPDFADRTRPHRVVLDCWAIRPVGATPSTAESVDTASVGKLL